MLTTGHRNTAQNGMGLCAGAGSIATIGFSGDNCWSQHALGLVIGGIQIVDIQKAQDVGAVFAQASGETEKIGILEPALWGDQVIQLPFQGLGSLGESSCIQSRLLGLQRQGSLQNGCQLLYKPYRPASFALSHFVEVSQQVPHAFLLEPGSQALLIIGYEAPNRCFRSAARAFARGPTNTPAAPAACEICSGCCERTRLWQSPQ